MKKKYKILIDVGSLTVKVYKLERGILTHLVNQSINFKNGFSAEESISPINQKNLFTFINSIKKEYPEVQIKIFATAIFRKMSHQVKIAFIDQFFLETGLFFNIVDHDLENFYLEMALVEKCQISDPILLINIGGGSTELVIMQNLIAIERHNIDIGVGTINEEFNGINEGLSTVPLVNIVKYIKNKLPKLNQKVAIVFYSGGELNYMRLVQYKLQKNTLFNDNDHPSLISVENFGEMNKKVFSEFKMSMLEGLMPENPTWMHGARGCSALAQAICEKYNIKTIIPSDTDLIHGVARQEYRTVTLSGSFRKHLPFILNIKKQLESKGVVIVSPRFTEPKNPGEEFVIFSGEEDLSPLLLERHHLTSITKSDALIICDPDGYVGASAMIEIGYAQSLSKKIIFVEPPEEFMLKTLPAEIGI